MAPGSMVLQGECRMECLNSLGCIRLGHTVASDQQIAKAQMKQARGSARRRRQHNETRQEEWLKYDDEQEQNGMRSLKTVM